VVAAPGLRGIESVLTTLEAAEGGGQGNLTKWAAQGRVSYPLARGARAPSYGRQLLAAWAAQSAATGMLDGPNALAWEHAERGVA
jgi:hypothetical protein